MSIEQESNRLEVIWGTRLLDDGFLGIPNVIVRNYRKLGLEHGEFGFICTVLTYKHDTSDPYPTEDKLAEHLNCSVSQIKKWVKNISEKGLVLVGQRKSTDKKTWSSNVYNFRPLIDKALTLVGEKPLPPSDDYEIIYRKKPGIPEVSTEEPGIPEVSMEGTPEVSMDSAPEVYTNISINKQVNRVDNNNARARVDQNLTMKNQQPNNSIGVKDQNDPNETLSPPLRPLDTFTSDDSGVDVFTAMAGLTSPPSSDGQAPISPKLTLTLDELNEIYRVVEARMTAYTFPQKKKPYMLSKDDYTKLHNLLYSQVPLDFILSCIDYSSTHYPDKLWFGYCAGVTKTRWEIELAKQAPPEQIEWNKPIANAYAGNRKTKKQGESSNKSDRVVPAAPPGKYERFYQVYRNLGVQKPPEGMGETDVIL